jgi:hypothetical protein
MFFEIMAPMRIPGTMVINTPNIPKGLLTGIGCN